MNLLSGYLNMGVYKKIKIGKVFSICLVSVEIKMKALCVNE